MKMADLNKHKQVHDDKVANDQYIGPDKPLNTSTSWACLNRARKRMSYSIPGNTLGNSFIQALNTTEGTELFSVWELGDKELHKVILKNVKDDWDKDIKVINAPKGLGFEVGNTITWDRLKLRWLITWQDLAIDEYFRGEMRLATHLLRWKNSNGVIQEQWAAIQGPVETRAKYEQTRGSAIVERQNDSVEIWIGAKNKQAIKSFKKFSRIMINGRSWEVQVRDDITNDSVYRMTLIEDYKNNEVDDVINAIPLGEIDFGKNEEEITETNSVRIVGPSKIREKIITEFYAVDNSENIITDIIWDVQGAKSFETTPDGKMTVIGAKIGDIATITASSPTLGSNTITVKTVSLFADLGMS